MRVHIFKGYHSCKGYPRPLQDPDFPRNLNEFIKTQPIRSALKLCAFTNTFLDILISLIELCALTPPLFYDPFHSVPLVFTLFLSPPVGRAVAGRRGRRLPFLAAAVTGQGSRSLF